MPIWPFAVAAALQIAPLDSFQVRCELRGIYDEIAQTILVARRAEEIELFHQVFDAPNWTFIDQSGTRQTWEELREQRIRGVAEQSFHSVRHAIQQVTVTAESTVALVNVITIKAITDIHAKYGPPGETHSIAEVTPMRDTWIRVGESWKLQSREQLAAPRPYIDKMPRDIENPRCPTWKQRSRFGLTPER